MSKTQDNKDLAVTLAEKIVTSIKGAETGSAVSEGDVFNENLPADVSKEQAESLFNYVTVFGASGATAAKDVTKAAMKANAELKSVEVHVPMGSFGHADYRINRSTSVTVPPAEKGGASTKQMSYGSNVAAITFVGSKSKVGMLGAARQAIKEEFAKEFGDK